MNSFDRLNKIILSIDDFLVFIFIYLPIHQSNSGTVVKNWKYIFNNVSLWKICQNWNSLAVMGIKTV